MEYLNRNSGAIQAVSALLTVVLAAGALVGVKWQIDAADQIQRAQSARDIYREYLNMAINKRDTSISWNTCFTPQSRQYLSMQIGLTLLRMR
jgi:hypothetical protein